MSPTTRIGENAVGAEAGVAARHSLGERLTALAHASRSKKRGVAVVERSVSVQGAMPPLHSRREDETFYVLEGALTFFLGTDTVAARPGDVVVAPGGTARTYRAESEHARWLILTHVDDA